MSEPLSQVAMVDLLARNSCDRSHRVSVLARAINSADLNIAIKGLDQSWKLTGEYAAEKLDIAITSQDIRDLIQSIPNAPLPQIIDISPTS